MSDFDAIVIGSGAGGLSAAICLARAGQKVAVLEQHYVPGGWSHSFYIDGHRFTPGVHYVGLLDKGESTSTLYEGLGIANDLVFFRMNPKAYEHCWIGNERVDMPARAENLYESLAERFPKEKKGLKKYLQLVRNVSRQLHLIPKMNGFWDNVTIAYRTRHLGKYALFSLKRVVGWHIKDPLLQKVINIQCGDHGLPPGKASFPYHCAMMDHYLQGGFYPMGGGAAIVKAMTTAIKKLGGEVRTGMGVKRILVEQKTSGKGFSAVGVELQNGEKLTAKRIISNTDPTVTFNMVGKEYLSNKLQKKLSKAKYSATSLIFFLITNMDVRKAGLDSGNIWLMQNRDMDDVYDELMQKDITIADEFPIVFISCPSLKDPTSYHGQHHALEIVTYINYDLFKEKIPEDGRLSEEYKNLKKRLCDKLLNTIEKSIPGITNSVVKLELGTPITNDYYIQSTKGNVYGTEKGFYSTGPFSFTPQTEIENLYMCGASIMSHGVAGASYSGVKDLIKPDSSQNVRIYEAEDSSEWPEWLHQKIADKKRRLEARPELKSI
jgi:all-trans-retinol 13,14-reductase